MSYNIAIYVNDYLMLLEFQEMFEKVFPKEKATIFSTEKLSDGLGGDLHELYETDLNKIKEFDVVVLLHELNPKYLDGFTGSIVDTTSSADTNKYEVMNVYEPIRSIVENLDVDLDKLDIHIALPVIIYGKDGVEDFMRQTKGVFTFEESDALILKDRLAFNAHFNIDNLLADIPISKSIEYFSDNGASLIVDMLPLSTVFILDVASNTQFEILNSDGYVVPKGMFMASDVSESDNTYVLKNKHGFRFIGDYNKVLIRAISEKIKEVLT